MLPLVTTAGSHYIVFYIFGKTELWPLDILRNYSLKRDELQYQAQLPLQMNLYANDDVVLAAPFILQMQVWSALSH